jgi:amidohydrolase
MEVIKAVKKIEADIINWRRELHRIPGPAFELKDTSKFITDRLLEMGIEYRIIANTGVSATIYGGKQEGTVGLRADMDGLPIKEETGSPFAADNGLMHACGHDAHMAMLLGAAKILSENKQALKGNVRLIFQPAEESIGGAEMMIEGGCLDNPRVDAIFGLHIGSLSKEIICGSVGVKMGAMMAAVDEFRVRIIGKGGHGAAPQECVDPIVVAAEIICSLQKIVSREISPISPAVVTIGKITGGSAFNIIPDEVSFDGCVRTLSEIDRNYIERRIKDIVKYETKANNAEYEIQYFNKYPVLINDDTMTNKLRLAANKIVGEENVVNMKHPIMASEDMAYYLQKIPGTFFYLGSNNEEKGIIYPHHHPKFDVDEDVLCIGTGVLVQAVLDYFDEK